MPKLIQTKTLKLAFLAIALTAVFMSLGTDKASAAAWNDCGFGNGDDFGVRVTGQHSNEMGGLKIKAQYANGDAVTEKVNFTLNSDVPSKSGTVKDQQGNNRDVDERIFQWEPGHAGRSKEKTFTIGGDMYPGPFNCNGRLVLGPGLAGERGNGWVLDCIEAGEYVDFWVSSIQNPGGKKGTWTYLVDGNQRPMSAPFHIRNGDNVRIDLVFTPEEPDGKIQSVECDRVRLIGYVKSDPSRYIRFQLKRGNGALVADGWTNQANQPHWYNTGLGGDFSATYPGNITLRLSIDVGGGVFQEVDNWQGSKRCGDPDDPTPNCTHVRFTIPSDSKALDSGNDWNPPTNQSWYAVYVNDWGSPGRPAAAGSSDYYPNGSGDPAGSGRYNDGPGPWVDYSSYDNPGSETVGEGTPIDRNLREHNKVVSGQLVWTVVVYDWFKNSSGVWRIQVQYRNTVVTDNCFQADCSVSINGNVPGREGTDAVVAGSTLRGTVRIRNTGVNNLPSWMITNSGTFGLSLTTNYRGGLSPNHLNEAIPPGGQIERPLEDFGLVAPNDVNNHSVSFYPDYWGRAGIGGWCSAGFRTFKEFNLSPSAGTLSLQYNGVEDVEDPNAAVFNWVVNNVASNRADVSIPATRYITKNGSDFPPFPQTNNFTYGDVSRSDSAPISISRLGDRYCGRISISPVRGWEGPGDRVVLDAGPRTDSACNETVNYPYTRIYGADVVAGSNFLADEVCNPGNSQIRAYTSSHADKSGSGAQLAAVAMNTIESFRTASLRTSAPTAPNGLSFGNDGGPTGQYNGEPLCSTDFYNETQSDNPDKKDAVSSATINLSSPASYHADHDQTLVSNGSHKLSLNGVSGFNDKKIIYVDGDVRINSNIAYAPFSDPMEAPAFMVVASGNIYVSRNVTRLDGIYVAQQRPDNSGGTIFTCAKPGQFDIYNPTEIFNNCGGPEGEGTVPGNRQLTVNGAFIANDVRLHRVHKSVRDSRSNTQETADVTQASEIFNFSPEIYLSQPPFATDSSATSRFQYYTTLPPIL